MVRSMTGYGRGEQADQLYIFKVEIKSVNHRYSDINIKMPRHMAYMEDSLKRIIKGRISRGKIDVYINLEYINESAMDIKVDIPLALNYKAALLELTKELELGDDLRINNILTMSDIIKVQRREVDEDLAGRSLIAVLEIALDDLIKMKTREGMELKADMLENLQRIEKILLVIEERTPIVVLEYKEKLRERISEILDKNINLDEERLDNEIVFFADKSNINEELVRLKSHIKQFTSILEEGGAIGRKLEFLIQELNREINTIGSKANDMEISQNVVEIKSELEKIREQIQNVE